MTVWQSSGRGVGTIAEDAFSPSPSSPPAASALSSAEDAVSEPLPAAASEQKHTILPCTGPRPLLSALRSGDLASAPATTTLTAAVAARGLLAASHAGTPAAAAARSIGGGGVEGKGKALRRADLYCQVLCPLVVV
uniref:Uncharacterized protein n=1 Tax=Arundo donax TaxID=35708 RepID=A0A0A9AFN0_ARUDO